MDQDIIFMFHYFSAILSCFFSLMAKRTHSLLNMLHQRIADFMPLKPLQMLTVMLQYGD